LVCFCESGVVEFDNITKRSPIKKNLWELFSSNLFLNLDLFCPFVTKKTQIESFETELCSIQIVLVGKLGFELGRSGGLKKIRLSTLPPKKTS
jgi:hypothetical protein